MLLHLTTTLFALDIGTRSVVGIILKENGDHYHVADLVSIEHKERSMIDGQIHNILSVAKVIIEIKELLEAKHGPLKRVSVAAAGRALVTMKGSINIDLSKESIISTEDVNRLELSAVQNAQQKLLTAKEQPTNDYYYCVGYSVLHYKLEEQKIGSLIDQIGNSAAVEVIATFLPQVVVESLLSALKRAGLEMEALTLEPIAAIQVLIPPSMRRLNVALVDIGAGTSDIAIADNDTVIAYGMVPAAGDAVTEALSNEYLLDFPIAEKIKRQLKDSENVVMEDILGFEETIPTNDVTDKLTPTTQHIAQLIADEIHRLNNEQSPKAVILVGGGSLTPNLPSELSTFLDLPKNRVAIRGLEALTNITFEESIGTSPDLVTPIGIAIAAKRAPIHYMAVTVNDKKVRLFELKEMTIADALLASNISAKDLYGKPGHGIRISFNGEDLILPGEHGKPSIILLNGEPASSKDLVKNEDSIVVILGKDGQDAAPNVQDLVEEINPIQVKIDEQSIRLTPEVFINGKQMQMNSPIYDRDIVTVSQAQNLAVALKKIGHNTLNNQQSFIIYVNKKPLKLPQAETLYFLGTMPIKPTYNLSNNDHVTIRPGKSSTIADVAALSGIKISEKMSVTFNGENVTIQKKRYNIILNGHPSTKTKSVRPNDKIVFTPIDENPILFSDVFSFTDFALPSGVTGSYQILRNGIESRFNEQIFGGDNLEISFS